MWNASDIPSQAGRTAIITGATSGLGLAATRDLTRAGAHVVLAARNPVKAHEVIQRIREAHPGARLSFEEIDTADLHSVSRFAERWNAIGEPIDLLLLNAGVAGVTDRSLSPDGFEEQFATNYLGHFALTGLLLPMMRGVRGTRIVAMGSKGADFVEPRLDDPQSEHPYHPMRAYRWSKLALITFALELNRRLATSGSDVVALAAHPGLSRTAITRRGGSPGRPSDILVHIAGRLLGQSAERGVLPLLYAATATTAVPGGYYGPNGFRGLRGSPALVAAPALPDATRLWSLSEQLTNVRFLDSRADPA